MDKIDLIIDALEKAKDGWQSFDEYEKALAAARELKSELLSQWEITVKRKTVYGNETIYPVCDTAICLTMLGDTKTLTPRQVNIIKALGYKINLEQQEEV
jgi:hypothetical protein